MALPLASLRNGFLDHFRSKGPQIDATKLAQELTEQRTLNYLLLVPCIDD